MSTCRHCFCGMRAPDWAAVVFRLVRGATLLLDSYLLVPTAASRGTCYSWAYMKSLPTVLFLAGLVLIPAAVAFERLEPETWQSRLVFFPGKDEINRHTPLQTDGAFLPPRLERDLTFTPEHNPIILPSRTEVAPNTTVTFTPGTHLYAHEFSELAVLGTLRMQGAQTKPITLTTNERHPQNQLWNGIIIEPGGQAEIAYTHFEYASPALTCLPGSTAELSHSEIKNALIGIFTSSPDCHSTNNRIQTIRDKIISKF